MMNRQRVAQECVTIERCGGNVLDYLRGSGAYRPGGRGTGCRRKS